MAGGALPSALKLGAPRLARAVAARAPLHAPGSTLKLYRDILRAHRKYLPPAHRDLGDTYVKAEFRLHKNAKPEFLQTFERQWRDYLTHILADSGDAGLGRPMTAEEVEALSDEQKAQLLAIHEQTKK